MSKLSVIIVNYRVKHYLDQCLRSVEQAIGALDVDVWVVDNNSGDDSVECLRKWHPDVRIIANSENVGFSRANNQAIKSSTGDYVLLLNPDTVIGEDVLAESVHFMDTHPDAGAVGVKMLSADGRFAKESRRGVPTPLTAFFKMSGLCSLFPHNRFFGHYYMSCPNPDSPTEIEIVSGAFMLLRRQALNQVGLLDEDFFMYGEDIDLSYRLLKGGYHNYYLPLSIIHYKGESTVKSSYKYVYVFYQAMLIFFRKHFGNRGLLLSYGVKAAIFLRASLAYVQMQIKKRIQPFRKKTVVAPPLKLTVHSSAQVYAESVTTLFEQKKRRGRLCLFNPDCVSYADAIREIERQDGPATLRKEIAFVYPGRQTVVTSAKVYSWKE